MGCRTQSVSCLKEATRVSIETLLYPIVCSGRGICRNKEITVVVLIAIGILVICAKYANTQPMHNFNKGLSHGYKVTTEFLSNKTHAILVGCTGGILYLLIGREFVNRDNNRRARNEGWNSGRIFGFDEPRTAWGGVMHLSARKSYSGEVQKYKFDLNNLKISVVAADD